MASPGMSAVRLLLLLLTLTGTSLSQPHLNGRFRGGIIMARPDPGGTPYQIDITFYLIWKRSYAVGGTHYYCSDVYIANHIALGQYASDYLECQYGCYGRIRKMTIACIGYSIADDWTLGENWGKIDRDFSSNANMTITVGFTSQRWQEPILGPFNISTTFSLSIRNDTGRVNSSPRSMPVPIVRLQEECNHTIVLPVSDPDGDVVRCRWAEGSECANGCDRFLGAELHSDSCTIQYQASMGTGYKVAAIMIEDFISDSLEPLSIVALQFLVLVFPSDEIICYQKPVFVTPTILHGSCVAIPAGTIFTTQLVARSGRSDVSITEIQTTPPLGTIVGELTQISDSNRYYINVTWTPDMSQQNFTHMFCFTAVGSDQLATDQTCINLLPGYYPPVPIQETATPYQQLVYPTNTTWHIRFDIDIERPSVEAYITFNIYNSEEEVYSIDVSQSSEVAFEPPNAISITPNFTFNDQTKFYITLGRGVVQGIEQCRPGNEPVTDKNFWTFETVDLTPPIITFLLNPSISNTNVSFAWESNENVTWKCIFVNDTDESLVDCSGANWMGYGLSEGVYHLKINATDEAGNTATTIQTFVVDLTPPESATITSKPRSISNQQASVLTFSCTEICSYECRFVTNMTLESLLPCNGGIFFTPILHSSTSYTLFVIAIDQVGNRGDSTSYTWETDFESPRIFGIQDTSAVCSYTLPEYTGHAQVVDNRPENVLLMYRDHNFGCIIRRTWMATDIAGNIAQLDQNIDLEFSPVVTLLPQVTIPCDSTAPPLHSSTAYAPNPCGLPLNLTYEDLEYICPGTFVRNWTVLVCGNSANASQIVHSYDLCPPQACGRSESTPHGICSLGQCQCNQPWYGENCSALIYEPVAHPVNDSLLLEAQEYTTIVALSQGTPPLTWSLISGPQDLLVDQYTGRVMWRQARAGNYSIVVQIENQIYSSQVEWNLLVTPGYNASLLPVIPIIFPYVQPVILQGYVEYETDFVNREDSLPVDVDIVSDGTVKTLRTYTTINGSFSLTFYLASTEYGTYTAGARHPNSMQSLPQAEWEILGMRSESRIITLNGEAISDFENTFYNATIIYNDGPGPLNGLTATPLLPNTSDVSVEVFLRGSLSNTSLEPGEQLFMDIKVVTSRLLNGLFLVSVEAVEGTTLQLIASLRIEPLLPILSINPPSLVARIVPGRLKVFQFNVTNFGRAPANNVQSIIPRNDFISFIGFGNTQLREGSLRLESGESALLSILAQTPTSQQLGEIDTTIIITSNEAYTPVPVTLIVSSDSLMNLTVTVEDEYTYFASGRPLVSNADITLINYDRDLRLTQSTDLGNGMAKFFNIYEDRYEMIVKAPLHRSLQLIIVTSVESSMVTVFIERQTVTYTWSVTPITFQDVYSISIEADFETRVPVPVVTVTPNEINLLELEAGNMNSFQLNITNHGLIRADNVGIQFPSHPFLEFSTNMPYLGHLEPLSSIIVSINSTRKSLQKRNALNNLGNDLANAVNWALYVIDVVHSYVCNVPQQRKTPVVLKQPTICGNQLNQPILFTPSRGGGVVGGAAYYTPVSAVGGPRLAGPTFGLDLGGPGDIPGVPSFSFLGYSSEPQPVFCNPCVSALIGCLASSPLELAFKRLPLAGCIPLIVAGTNPVSSALNATKWLQCIFGNPLTGLALCAYENGLFDTCTSSSTSNRNKRNVRRSVNEVIEALYPIQQNIALGIEVLGDERWISLGDPQWLSTILRPTIADESEAGVLISTTELSAILAAPPPNGTTLEMVASMVQRINNTVFGWNNGQLEPEEGSNMASFTTVQELARNIDTYNEIAIGKGFSSYIDAYNFASGQINQISDLEEEAGVCAVVRIRIQQELAITREAFLARLQIENMEDSSLEEINIEIIITDLITGELSTNLFSIGNGSLSGSLSTSINGKWLLPSDAVGAVEWLIIPYSEAAPDSDHIYNVGGSLSYLVGSENITVPLSPTPITVMPDPSLLVHYFWERYVVADNPFTDVVEPSVPFTLGVAVKNAGYGTAYSLQISSAQPEIIDNERGLLINFMIIGANIGGERAIPSLTVRFGDLDPNTTAIARWYMISSLQGEFMSYSATFENMNPLGDPKLSVLDDLKIHELIRNVIIYTSNEDDGIPDFLVNDQDDYLAYPDALYSSKNLQQYNVSAGIVLSVHMNSENIMTSSLVVRTATNSTGWVYYRYEDTQGILNSTASSVNGTKVESNRMIVLPSENSWITRDRDETTETETFYLHILDYVEVTDEVVFSLDPCTVDCPTLGLPFTRPTVKLPTPSVSVTAPMEILYAGSATPLTLICNVAIDPSLADNVNVSVTWMKGTAQLSNSTSRTFISPLSESQSLFTSILTVYPLSTADSTNFTCKAGIIPLSSRLSSTTASDFGEGTALVIVEVPPVPVVNIVASSDLAIVGESLNLICSTMIVPDSLFNDPILTWSGPGVEQNSVQLSKEALNLSLSFTPLYTSHGGVYFCTVRLAIPEAGVDVAGTQVMTVYAKIPPPSVTITRSPRDTDFFQGLDITFTCEIELSSAVDSAVMVQSNWQTNKTVIEGNSDDRITVTNATIAMPLSNYQTTIRFNPMDFDDADAYTCAVTVIPQNDTFIAGTSGSMTRNISDISSFPPQNVTINDEGVSIAGYSGYSLLCTGIRDQDLSSSTTISIQWLDPNGLEVSGNQSTNTSSEGSANDVIVTSTLTFNSLLTSQAGQYTCRTAMTIPGTDVVNHTVDESFIVIVKLPAPKTVAIYESRILLYEGTSFSLDCMISPNMTGVDTDFEVQRNFIGPETSDTDRITQLDTVTSFNDIELSLIFIPLIMNDSGTYECSAIVRSILPNVIASDPVMNDTTLSILQLPAPEVTIYSAVSLPIAGDNHTLLCSAITEAYLITSPTLKWISIEDIVDASTLVNGSTLALNFHPLRTSHGGSYTCEATLDIPQAGINNLTSSETENITVQISTPVLSIADHPIPYNGTLFTLSGVASLEPSVDTDVTAIGIWSDVVDSPQLTTSPPYQMNLAFRPLATDSSDVYILNVTFIPSDGSPFIVENSGRIVYRLMVQPLPIRPPTISVISRYPSVDNDCGEARILNCTANPVDNLFIPPIITWIGPDGYEVSVGGNSNPMIGPQTGQLVFSDITSSNSGQYVCRSVVNISEANILNHFDEATTNVDTNAPGPVRNLICNETSSSSELHFSWESPAVLGEAVSGYQIEVKELQHRDDAKDVVSIDVTNFNTNVEEASLNEGLTGMVPYEIRVKAINLAGCGEQHYVYCFTQEGEPPSPNNVVIYKLNSTAINVTWDKQTLVELKGLADYIIEYRQIVSNKKRQSSNTVTVPWTESHVIITNLTPGAQYDVSVSVSTSVGMSDPVRGMIRDVSTTPPSVADDKVADIGVIVGSTALALVFMIITAVALTIAVVVAIVIRNRRNEFKLRSSKSFPPAVSGKMLSSIKDSYENPCYDVKPEQQQSSL